jgi:hypothetical protein
MKAIPLTRGLATVVDDEDYEMLSKLKWCADGNGYAVHINKRGFKPRLVYMHRFLLLPDPNMQIDHINRDKLDNRRENIRICTAAENRMNRPAQVGGASPYKGVSWDYRSNKWQSYIRKSGKGKNLGRFTDPIRAALAYDLAALEMHGKFACPNFLEAP